MASGRYRADIDGLRAIAILPVMAFHMGVSFVSGGFVGVDIFFVISGFLITRHLQSEMIANKFSLTAFYERRLRRIAPAFLVMLAIISSAAWVLMLPAELHEYGASAITAVASVANFYFWFTTDYFAAPAFSKPLLHTWSLAVEEQYYFLFPLLLYYSNRLGIHRRSMALIGITALSFSVSAYEAFLHPTTAFYLPHSRAWELLLGALLALQIIPAPASALMRNICATLGLAVMGLAFLFISDSTPFPGIAAIPPCVGAALVIAGSEKGETWAGRFLQMKPLVFIGIISYSLYLWHWPLIVIENTFAPLPSFLSATAEKSILLAAIFAMGIASWLFVEKPFRDRNLVSTTWLLRFSSITALLLAIAGAFMAMADLSARFSPSVAKAASYLNYDYEQHYRVGTCFISTKYTELDFDWNRCMTMRRGNQNYLILGDSHAADLWPGLKFLPGKQNLMQATASGCKPLLPLKGEQRCTRLMTKVYEGFARHNRLDGVLLSARWSKGDLSALERTLDWWASLDVPVTLIGPSPIYEIALPRLLARAGISGDENIPDRFIDHRTVQIDAMMASLAARKGISYISLYKAFCNGSQCRKLVDDVPLMFDTSHFTEAGSVLAAHEMQKQGLFKE